MLKYKVTSLDDVEEAVRHHYVEKNGAYVLELDDKDDERIQGLIRNRNEALAEKDKLSKQIKELEAKTSGDALEEHKAKIQELEEKLENAGKSGKYSEDQINQIKADLENKYKTKLSEKDETLKQTIERVKSQHKKAIINDALNNAGVKRGARDLMASYLANMVDLDDPNGTMNFVDKVRKPDGSGHEVSELEGGNGFKTTKELVEELKMNPDYGFAFEGSKASGGGAETTKSTGLNGTGGIGNVSKRSDLKTYADKAKYVRELADKLGDENQAMQEYMKLPE